MVEVWKEIEMYNRKYEVSNLGRVRTVYQELKRSDGVKYIIKPKLLKQRLNKDGYPTVTLGFHSKRTRVKVHRLVAIAFIPNPLNKKEVNHIDFDRTNNKVENLEWTTHKENIRHSIENNSEVVRLSRTGSKNGRSKLTEKDIIEIRNLYDNGMTRMEIAKKFNRGWTTIDHIIKRETWKHVA